MRELTISLWGRPCTLEVVFDCYDGEEVLPHQEAALDALLKQPDLLEQARSVVEGYCLTMDADRIGAASMDNIFKYVVPKALFVKRSAQAHVVALMCNYRFRPEDGIAVVFQDEQISQIGTQSIIL